MRDYKFRAKPVDDFDARVDAACREYDGFIYGCLTAAQAA